MMCTVSYLSFVLGRAISKISLVVYSSSFGEEITELWKAREKSMQPFLQIEETFQILIFSNEFYLWDAFLF